jgi:predicted ATPase/DNA-binding CsgD family transcriptional regulator
MPEENFTNTLVEPLTRREMDVLQLLVDNFSNSQIEEKLTLAPNSVKWYVKQIYAKLGVHERSQVIERANELGLITNYQQVNTPRHNLPSSMTPFIGRQSQIEHVRRMIIDPNCRLITLTGAGGVGKTRLALKVAETSVSGFFNGVWLVELASVNDPNLVNQSIASVLGLAGNRESDTIDLLCDYLRDKKILLVLDNCEQLIEGCAQSVEALLHTCPGLKILVTSREALDIEGEIPFSVPSLTFPDPHHLPEIDTLPQYEAVKLFQERTRSFVTAFCINESNAGDIARICQRLDGIPLALELAAARVKILGVDQIAAHLEESFQLLTGGFRTALPRHQTMRASIEWSYGLLSETEKILLHRFSVFAGGWTLEAAKEICIDRTISAYTVINLLAQLVNKSLVTMENEPDGGIRYYLLDAIWDFAHEKLADTDENKSIHNAHVIYFLKLAETAEPNFKGQDQISWLDRLGRELPNLRVALGWGLNTDPYAELRLASAIAPFWQIRGNVSEGLSWLSKGLNSASVETKLDTVEETKQQKRIAAKALVAIGFLWKMNSEYSKAMTVLEESLVIFRDNEYSEQTGLADALLQQASCATALGNYRQANESVNESLRFYQESKDLFGISECYLVLGNNETDPGRAKSYFLDAMEIKRRIGDTNGLAYTLQQLCEITVYETDFERTYAWLDESLDFYQKAGNKKSVVNTLYFFAWLAWVMGDYFLATRRISESISLSQHIEETVLLSRGLLLRSDIQLSQGDNEACLADIQAAQKIGQKLANDGIIASAMVKQGRLAIIQGKIAQADKILQDSFRVSRTFDKKNTVAFNLYNLGRVACAQNDLGLAKSYFQQSMRLFYDMNFWYWDYIAYSLEGLARIAFLQSKSDQAARLYGAASHLFQGLGNTVSPLERQWREDDLATIRVTLGDESFKRLWDEGHALTTEEAMVVGE